MKVQRKLFMKFHTIQQRQTNELPRSRAARYQRKYNNGVCIANLLFDFTP